MGCLDRQSCLHAWKFWGHNWIKLWSTYSYLIAEHSLSRRLDWRRADAVSSWVILQSYMVGSVWRHGQQSRVRQPFCSSLMPILSTTTAPQRGMCFNIWAILVARCWHLIWPCVFHIISSSQRFKDIAGSRAWMVLCALPSTLEGSQPQGGSSLQEGGYSL